MAYFWRILDGIAVLYPLAAFCTPKNGFSGSKGENFEIFKILDPAHFWGSGGLIMLPQGLEDVCEQRGPPDDDFEYWTASVPRRGAEIWAAKVLEARKNEWFRPHFSGNFGRPYLGSPTWYTARSVLKIIVWRSSLLTNIFKALGKHNKASRASEVSRIENVENLKNFPFLTQKPIFLGAKGSQWI